VRAPEIARHGDNCWDHFNCHASWPSAWLAVAPRLRALYLHSPKPRLRWADGLSDGLSAGLSEGLASGARVVLHIRRNDVGQRKLPASYYARAIAALREELRQGGKPLFRVQTDSADFWREFRRHKAVVGAVDIVVDYAKNTSLNLTFHRMVSADVLVMSASSLSMAAALLRHRQGVVLFPECYKDIRRPLPSWRLWRC
jgi:hypothetical protein